MILGFSTQINGKETFFVEKIWQSFPDEFSIDNFDDFQWDKHYNFNVDAVDFTPKLHTIRLDKNDHWKKGRKIDFIINVRKKNMLRFAPVLPVVSTQKVEIKWYFNPGTNICRIEIDNKGFAVAMWHVGFDKNPTYSPQLLAFVQNDGFDSVEDFFNYFDKDFLGKIIHWTDLKY
ncbi:MAG: hypothetical protein ABIP27_17535 [Flavobacterium circumlabens]|uniref:hypothetical protein n=1 Tax=Flavobacterium circumlabens TaxID=2133765 RepID=UPI0032657C86